VGLQTPVQAEIVRRRIHTQGLARPTPQAPEAVVQWLGAVQAQDYAGAKWGIGQRALGLTDAAVDAAFNAGRILRTHIMRPTWHFVTPADIRSMLVLTGPRVQALNGFYYRLAGLDAAAFRRSHTVIERALRDGRHKTREELAADLAEAGMGLQGQGLAYVVMEAELAGLICSGPRRGKQFTYALLDERAGSVKPILRDEALAALTSRYFTGHGPATIRDFAWWSGLTVRDVRSGLAMIASTVRLELIDGLEYWSVPLPASARVPSPMVYLLPNYDEALIAYKDRGVVSPDRSTGLDTVVPATFPHHLLIDGRVAGGWRRTLRAGSVDVEVRPSRTSSAAERRALLKVVERYGVFLGLRATLSIGRPARP
jgi:hypothetical protein